MTYAPDTLKTARLLLLKHLPISPLSVGIIGDDNHTASGSSYHLGKTALRADSYTIVESPRDKNGLTDAAAALDIGSFAITVAGKRHDLRSFSIWLAARCKAGTADTADIREVIYSADGTTVKRWDRLGRRSSGDNSHLSHTHVSYFRDSEARDKTGLYRTYLTAIGLLGDDDMDQNELLIGNQAYPNRTKGDAYADLMNFIDSAFWANPQYARRGPEANSWFAQLGTMAKAFPAMQQQLQAVAAGQTALATNLAALPGAVAAELEDEGGVDGTVVQAAVERALAKLRLTVGPGGPTG